MFHAVRKLVRVACVLLFTFASPSFAAEPLMVFAAASLKDSLEDIGKAYTASGGGTVKFSFAASSLLAKQIEGGNLADLYASADLKWMDYLDEKALVKHDTRVNLLGNSLVVIAPATATLDRLDLDSDAFLKVIGESRLSTCDVNAVPAGIYAKSALQTLGMWNAIEPKLAQSDNVRSALAFVAKGEAPLGIVYETDAKVERNVKIVATFPAMSHEPIVYPFAITTASTHPEARAFLDFLKGPIARALFEKAGFPVLIK